MIHIGNQLKEIRLSCKLSINNVIKKLEEFNIFITKKTFYRWECDKVIPDLETIKVLSYIYQTNICAFYEDTRYYKALTENEYKFINLYRENNDFKKIVKLLSKI